jgi:hypothetical protein
MPDMSLGACCYRFCRHWHDSCLQLQADINEKIAYGPREPYLWAGFDYLHWWMRESPVRGPLLTIGDLSDPIPGAVGQPGTRVLFGDDGIDYGEFSGFRTTIGWWFDPDLHCGFEFGGFLLEHSGTSFAQGTDSSGNPPLFFAILDPDTLAETSAPISSSVPGGTLISAGAQFWGAEANLLCNLCRNYFCSVDLFGGFRYLDLDESLRIQTATASGTPLASVLLDDRFATRNQLFAGQIGLKTELRCGCCFLLVRSSIALGNGRQVVNIEGGSTASGASSVSPGGFFALPGNIGRYQRDEFTYAPEITVKVGFHVAPGIRVYGGYDFLWWSEVVRPGEQIDRAINGSLSGSSPPNYQFRTSEFWIHGVSAGVQVVF